MPGFHHSVAVLSLPFRRSAVVKFRCSVKITYRTKIPFRYSRKQQKDTQRQRCSETETAKRQRKNDNGMVETGHYAATVVLTVSECLTLSAIHDVIVRCRTEWTVGQLRRLSRGVDVRRIDSFA